ncbi:MAG TPA: HD domain-containing phosphohydrolase, partial [Gemmataceae bacterium]|nr:HD domain-containing phosphohydrolase [Gemmataceae bacterium]
ALLRYFVMEYVPGMDLDEYVQTQGPLSLRQACDIIYQVAGALGEAHKHNLVHRDIKPSNIRLTPRGQAKLLDFGLARHLPSRMTDPGTLLGSLDYISPEQASDAGTVDIRTDIYGLGGTMFWCLTGRPPFVCQEGILQQVACRLTQQPPSVRSLRPDLPTRVEDILIRMLATKPEDRYPTPHAVMEALEPYLELAQPNQGRPAFAGRSPVKTPESVDLATARIAMVQGLAKLVQFREGESEAHLVRLERYCRRLAEEAGTGPDFAGKIHSEFIDQLVCCASLHDIGKVGLPDHLLMKPGKLDANERILMQTHTIIGADLLKAMARQYGSPLALLQMAPEIARHHHERFDGKGYPDQLAGSDIPLAARMVTICDVYDALRSRRSYKPALFHNAALQVMTETCQGQFDPDLLKAFHKCAHQFEKIFKDFPD